MSADENGPEVAVHLCQIDGRWEVVGIDLRARHGAITAADLRSLKLPDLRRRELARRGLVEPAHVEVVRPLRTELDRYHFLLVAETYAKAWRAGENPTEAVADRFGVPTRTAARWVGTARNRHRFLRKTEKFKPNGELTARALHALEVAS